MVAPLGKLKSDEAVVILDESDDLRRMMAALGKRSRIVRSYVHNCMDMGMSVIEWRRKVKGTPAHETWYKPYSKGGKYWGLTNDHDPLFRTAITEYWTVLQRTRTAQHLRLSALAEKKMQEAVPMASDSMIKLAGKARNEQTKYNAARFLISQRARTVDVEDAALWDEAEDGAGDDDADAG